MCVSKQDLALALAYKHMHTIYYKCNQFTALNGELGASALVIAV